MVDEVTGICLFLEVQEGKGRMEKAKYRDMGYPSMVALTLRLVEQ